MAKIWLHAAASHDLDKKYPRKTKMTAMMRRKRATMTTRMMMDESNSMMMMADDMMGLR